MWLWKENEETIIGNRCGKEFDCNDGIGGQSKYKSK